MNARAWLVAAAVAISVTALYAALSWNSGFLYDDQALIEDEPRPASAAEVLRAFTEPHYGALPYYRPLVRVSYLVQKALHGNDPRPYHVFNALLAGAIALAAWLLLRSPPFLVPCGTAVLAAGAFLMHPAAGACVLPIAGRDSLLPTLFVLVAAAAHLRAGPLWRAAAPLAFLAALFSKELAVATPLLLLAADATISPSRPSGFRAWAARYAPFAAALALYGAARAAVLPAGTVALAILERPLAPLVSLAFGVQTALAPAFQLVYEPPYSGWLAPLRMGLALLAALLLLSAARRGGLHETAWFWAIWFVAVQLPSANLLAQETLLDERYVFLAVLAPIALVAALARDRQGACSTVLAAAALSFASIEIARAPTYASPRAFHEQWARTNPSSAAAWNGLGTVRLGEGRVEEALAHFERSVALRPEDPQALSNLGVALLSAGRPADAASRLRQALELRPAFAKAWYNLGNALASAEPTESEAAYREALRLRPAYSQAWNNLAALLVTLGRTEEALAAFGEVRRLDPSHTRARLNYGILLARSGRLADAVLAYEEVLALAPSDADAHFDLAGVLEQLGRSSEAHAHYGEALRLRPGWAAAEAGRVRTASP